MMVPPPTSNRRNIKFAPAKVASARSVPAISKANPEKALMPRSINPAAASKEPVGRHPSRRATTLMRMTGVNAMVEIANVFASTRPERPRGVVPRWVSTP